MRLTLEKKRANAITGQLVAPLIELAVVVCASFTCKVLAAGGANSISFTGINGTYVAYPQWTLSPGGQLTLSFLTSEENGTLLSFDTAAGLVQVILGAGTLSVRSPTAGESRSFVLGSHLNDGAPHDLSISLSNDRRSLRLQLAEPDSNLSFPAVQLDCTPPTSCESRSPIYVGGAPSNYSNSFLVPFAGCVLHVTSSSNGSGLEGQNSSFVVPFLVSSENAIPGGCRTPCDDNPCAHNSSCVYRWGAQAAFRCDCRDVSNIGAGPYCSDDPASVSRLTFNGTTYHCFNLPRDMPYSGAPETSIVQILPGHPETGTIMTGTTEDRTASFSLSLTERRLTFSLETQYNFVKLKSQATLFPTCAYQVEVTIDVLLVTMVITNTSYSRPEVIDNTSAPVPPGLVPQRFNIICVGGGDLEVPIYVGSLQSLYHRRYALGELRNFAAFGHNLVQRSTSLRFLPQVTDPPLTFQGPFSRGLSFSFVTQLPGPLLMAANDDYMLSVLIAMDQMLFITLGDNRYGNYTYFTAELALKDGVWHTFELAKGEGDAGEWKLSIDEVTCFVCSADGCGQALNSLSSAPVQVGWKTQSFLGGNPLAFTGCMKDFRFLQGTSPNLEVMSRRAALRFSVDGCPDHTTASAASRLTSSPPPPPPPSPSLKSPDHTVTYTRTTSTGTVQNRKQLYAAGAIFGALLLFLVAVVCTISLQKCKRTTLVSKGEIAKCRSQTEISP